MDIRRVGTSHGNEVAAGAGGHWIYKWGLVWTMKNCIEMAADAYHGCS